MKSIPELQALINKEIEQLDFGTSPENLYEPISYILSLGGKRIRPLLVLLGHQLVNEDITSAVRPALAVEVFHNFTLMHDDIMDDAPLRRGMPTVHEKWNSTIAILSGDTMMVKAYDFLTEIEPALLPEALRLFNRTAVEVCEGQQIDMNFESRDDVTITEYLDMIRLKTAVLLGFSLEYGALMAGMPVADRKLLYEVGVKMGVGFQLMDDLLDVYADQSKFGKQVGGDIIANKKTFLLISALEQAQGATEQQLQSWIAKDFFDASKKVAAITNIYDQLNIRQQTTDLMNAYFDESFELLDKLNANDQSKELLRGFALQLMKREK